MDSSSPERGRTRSRQQTSAYAKAQTPSRTRSPRRSPSARSDLRSRSSSRLPPVGGDGPNGNHARSGSPSRAGSPAYREQRRSHSRSRVSLVPKSSKARSLCYRYGLAELTRLQIVVEKLTKNVNENHLFEVFGAYGPIKDLDLPINRQCMEVLQSSESSESSS